MDQGYNLQSVAFWEEEEEESSSPKNPELFHKDFK